MKSLIVLVITCLSCIVSMAADCGPVNPDSGCRICTEMMGTLYRTYRECGKVLSPFSNASAMTQGFERVSLEYKAIDKDLIEYVAFVNANASEVETLAVKVAIKNFENSFAYIDRRWLLIHQKRNLV